ncbi:hypothetical protein NUACC26_012640 [Scytonema sp. NUACC26]
MPVGMVAFEKFSYGRLVLNRIDCEGLQDPRLLEEVGDQSKLTYQN